MSFSIRTAALFALVLQLFIGAAGAAAVQQAADSNPEIEAKLHRIAQELRCLVCQNQTIADSNAELARDLRREAREMLVRGSSEDEVREFMVARYGDFVLYRPPVKATTWALWGGPFLLLAVALWIARRIVVSRRRAAPATALSAEERDRLGALIGRPESDTR